MLATGSNYTETVRLILSHKADAYEANLVSMRERKVRAGILLHVVPKGDVLLAVMVILRIST